MQIIAILVCYLIGAIPFGLMIGLWLKGVDVRNFGSGNLGATNTGRVLGKKLGYTVLLLDAMKGFVPLMIVQAFAGVLGVNSEFQLATLLSLAGSAAILGHVFPVYLKFRGGKGVATSIGVLLAIQPLPGLSAFTMFFITLFTFGYVSLGSVVGAASVPVFALLWNDNPFTEHFPYVLFGLCMAIVVVVRHRSNLKHIRDGSERKYKGEQESLPDMQLPATEPVSENEQ